MVGHVVLRIRGGSGSRSRTDEPAGVSRQENELPRGARATGR
jgi:hypothetical protein